jgi:hypothetical protein
MKEEVRRLMLGRDTFEPGSIYEEDVQPTIVVVVEESDATSNFLQQVPLALDAAKNVDGSAQTSLSGDIGERKSSLRGENLLGRPGGGGTRLLLKSICCPRARQQKGRGYDLAQLPDVAEELTS